MMHKNIFNIALVLFISTLVMLTSCAGGKYAVVEISTDFGEMTVALNEESKGLNDFLNLKSNDKESRKVKPEPKPIINEIKAEFNPSI